MFDAGRGMRAALLGAVLTAGAMAAGCDRESVGAEAAAPPERESGVAVSTTPVLAREMPVTVRAVGNVEPSSTVEIRPQVTGTLRTVGFTEGQDVTAGQLLFTIDARPFEAALKQADAVHARDMAQAKNLEAQRARLESLLGRGLVSPADYDAIAAQAAAMQSSIAASAAAAEQAQLQLLCLLGGDALRDEPAEAGVDAVGVISDLRLEERPRGARALATEVTQGGGPARDGDVPDVVDREAIPGQLDSGRHGASLDAPDARAARPRGARRASPLGGASLPGVTLTRERSQVCVGPATSP